MVEHRRSKISKEKYPNPGTQKFGQGRKKGVLNFRTLTERQAWVDACLDLETNPFIMRMQMLQQLGEMFKSQKDGGDFEGATLTAGIMTKYFDAVEGGLIPKRMIEDNALTREQIIDLLPVINTAPNYETDHGVTINGSLQIIDDKNSNKLN